MTTPPLNFDRAQYEGETVSQNDCVYCGRGITTEYYRVGGHMACPVCAQQAQSLVPPNSHNVFLRALSLGAAAAVVGCVGYALIIILTGWTIGYAAVGVGFLIGWAMRKTAGQHGGRRYQWAAALLTYAAVAVAFVPIFLHQMNKDKADEANTHQQTPSTSATASSQNGVASKPDVPKEESVGLGKFALSCVVLLGFGLISPVLEIMGSPAHGLLNAFIIFIGVRYAWQMMAVRTVEVDGPFEAATTTGPTTA